MAREPTVFDVSYLQEGRLTITCGNAMHEIDDPLFFMMPTFCFDAVVKLNAGEPCPYASWGASEEVTLNVEEDRIIISDADLIAAPPERSGRRSAGSGLSALDHAKEIARVVRICQHVEIDKEFGSRNTIPDVA